MAKDKVIKRASGTKGTKKLTPYNKYMKTELAKVKEADPKLTHQAAFRLVAQNWAKAKENPKNSK